MAKLTVNIGTSANDRTGDNLRTAFNKINTNFNELYTALGLDDNSLNLGAFEFTGSVMTTTDSSAITIDQQVTVSSDLNVGGDVVPNTDLGSSLGSATKRFKDLYISNNTIFLGNTTLGVNAGGTLEVGGSSVSSVIDYNDIQNTPTVPTLTSELTNDSGFVTAADTFNFNITGDDSTVRTVQSGSTIGIVGATGITTASDADGNITITGTAQDFAYSSLTGAPTIPTATSELTNDSGFLTSAEVVSDTTPQLGGDLETNDKNIYFADSQEHDWGAGNADNTLFFGAGGDLRMWVPLYGSIAYMQTFNSHALRLRGDNGIQFQVSGGYELITLGTDLNVDIGRAGQTITLTGNVDHGYVVENNIQTSETGSGSDKTLDTVDETVYLGAKYEVMFVTGSVVNYVEFFANLIEDEIIAVGPNTGSSVLAGDLYDYTSFAVGGTSGAKTVLWQIAGGVSGTVTATAKVKYYKA